MNKWFWIMAGSFWGISLLAIGFFLILINTSCERQYDSYPNYVYTFSCVIDKDEHGIETWGAHHFVVGEKIDDIESFKECYVNYLCWSGLDHDCHYKQIYYSDTKKVRIEYVSKSTGVRILDKIDNCR